MLKQKRAREAEMPRDLPMPKYDYQRASEGTYVFRYSTSRDAARSTHDDKVEAEFCAQKIKLAL
jgi:hypothetical protein